MNAKAIRGNAAFGTWSESNYPIPRLVPWDNWDFDPSCQDQRFKPWFKQFLFVILQDGLNDSRSEVNKDAGGTFE